MEGQRPVQAEDARDPRGLHYRGPTATTPRRGRASRLGNTRYRLPASPAATNSNGWPRIGFADTHSAAAEQRIEAQTAPAVTRCGGRAVGNAYQPCRPRSVATLFGVRSGAPGDGLMDSRRPRPRIHGRAGSGAGG
jgi:hypothetical protein